MANPGRSLLTTHRRYALMMAVQERATPLQTRALAHSNNQVAGFGFFVFPLPRHRVSRTRRTLMGVRIVVADKEPIALALKWFKRSLEQNGVSWEMRKRGFLIQPDGCTFKATAARRAKKFQKRFKARKATLLAKTVGEQATDLSASELKVAFWKRSGKP